MESGIYNSFWAGIIICFQSDKIHSKINGDDKMNWIFDRLVEHFQGEGHSYEPELNEFRCSMLNVCDRKMYYSKKYPVEPTEYQLGIFTVGHIIHKTIQDLVTDEFDCEIPVRYDDDLTDVVIVGHADLVSDDKVVDIKTVSRLPNSVYDNHHLQVNTYAYLLEKPYYGLLYVEKNTLQTRYFEFETSENLFNYVLEKCRTVYDCLITDILPANCPNYLCRFCPYKNYCLENRL